jgi:hypothetical protein
MPRISSKNQVTIPVAALAEAGLRAGAYPAGYLERLDAEDAER